MNNFITINDLQCYVLKYFSNKYNFTFLVSYKNLIKSTKLISYNLKA